MKRILYLECNSGISGDMTVGALLDLGADKEKLVRALEASGIGGYHLHFGRTKKCGIDAYDFDVHLGEKKQNMPTAITGTKLPMTRQKLMDTTITTEGMDTRNADMKNIDMKNTDTENMDISTEI